MKLVTEFWPAAIAQSGRSAASFVQALAQSGFKLYIVNERSADLQPAGLDALGRMAEESTNLFCIKDDRGLDNAQPVHRT